MNPFKQRKEQLFTLKTLHRKGKQKQKVKTYEQVPKSLLIFCPKCKSGLTKETLSKSLFVCPECSYHFKISANRRIKYLIDQESFQELDPTLTGNNPLSFPGYEEKLKNIQEETGLAEGVITGIGTIDKIKTVIGVLDSRFLMGSMGVAVGEKITRAIEYATSHDLPIIICSASGGARMQEGIFSLMQMAKTSAAIQKHGKKGLLYISVLTNPTTGGVTASFASLGDIIISEPGALIGFAGPRVIEQTIKQKLPEGFQSAEYLLEHGFLDAIVERKKLKSTLSLLLQLHIKRNEDIC